MNDPQMTELRLELEQDRDELLDTLKQQAGSKDDPLTQMLSSGLKDLEDALGKMSSGSYGRCEQCGKPIGELRLQSLPASRLCLPCDDVPTDDGPA